MGELEKRVEKLWARLESCDICPRECGVNRLGGEFGFCHSGYLPIIASFCDHHGEEPVLSGSQGSGTIFFGNCNLRCIYCQNHQISQDWQKQKANETDCYTLARQILYLQDILGCHNINFVSPSHFVPQIMRAVLEAIPMGLKIPLVYNTNSYDSLKTLKELNGIIDIYLPDLKYSSDSLANKLSEALDYVKHSQNAIKEMYCQVGDFVVNNSGVAEKGVIVRHLILPNHLAGSHKSLSWLAKVISPRIAISLMSQYHPTHQAYKYPQLSRPITISEYEEALEVMEELDLGQGWAQDMISHKLYLPNFKSRMHPFNL